MDNNLPTQNLVEVKLTAKGYYHWSIRTTFDVADTNEAIALRLKNIDTQLREKFAKNTSEVVGSGKFKEVDEFDTD